MDELQSEDESVDAEKMLTAIGKDYKFGKPEEVSSEGDKAKVKVEITSVDVGVATTAAIAEVMPVEFATAFDEDSEKADKAMEGLMESSVLKHIKSEDTPRVTRDVTLNLKKNKDGEYKIVSDDNFKEAVLANFDKVEDIFGEDAEETEAAEDQPEQKVEVIREIAKDKKYDANPIKFNIEEISLKKVSNVAVDEQERISSVTEKEVGDEFKYLYIKSHAENTSDEDYNFQNIQEVTVFADGKQETVDSLNYDFIDYDEGEDDEYYGKVNKESEVGVIFNTPVENIEKIRLLISPSNDADYENGTEPQIVEFELK
ncbi:hypothetical protein OKW24_002636 [Peribacillus simplex]|uniref:hypothetical protein n=1 Tax=Peribacillus simplex TaxID=1478 RepID=UPI0035C7888B|nr:hypothetical protein [Peribacillus simplex]